MKNKGYTIIEISVVLIFMSLILSIFIRTVSIRGNNNLKELIFNLGAYKSSVSNFKIKYGFLPGDLKKTQIFELSDNSTDGNENGLIEDKNMQNLIHDKPLKMDGEIANFWLHLQKSGYLGNQKNAIPYIKFLKSNILVFAYEGRNVFTLSVKGIEANKDISTRNVLTPFEAYYLDQKLDDGLPYSGNIFVTMGSKIYINQNRKNKKCAADFEYLTVYKQRLCQVLIELNI